MNISTRITKNKPWIGDSVVLKSRPGYLWLVEQITIEKWSNGGDCFYDLVILGGPYSNNITERLTNIPWSIGDIEFVSDLRRVKKNRFELLELDDD